MTGIRELQQKLEEKFNTREEEYVKAKKAFEERVERLNQMKEEISQKRAAALEEIQKEKDALRRREIILENKENEQRETKARIEKENARLETWEKKLTEYERNLTEDIEKIKLEQFLLLEGMRNDEIILKSKISEADYCKVDNELLEISESNNDEIERLKEKVASLAAENAELRKAVHRITELEEENLVLQTEKAKAKEEKRLLGMRLETLQEFYVKEPQEVVLEKDATPLSTVNHEATTGEPGEAIVDQVSEALEEAAEDLKPKEEPEGGGEISSPKELVAKDSEASETPPVNNKEPEISYENIQRELVKRGYSVLSNEKGELHAVNMDLKYFFRFGTPHSFIVGVERKYNLFSSGKEIKELSENNEGLIFSHDKDRGLVTAKGFFTDEFSMSALMSELDRASNCFTKM